MREREVLTRLLVSRRSPTQARVRLWATSITKKSKEETEKERKRERGEEGKRKEGKKSRKNYTDLAIAKKETK